MTDFKLQEFQIPAANNLEDESIDFSLLRLDSSTSNHYHSTPCTTCGCSASFSSNKRRSPDHIPPDQLTKKPKKLFLEPHESTPSNDNNNNVPNSVSGFSKIPLPICSTDPVLRRCHSDPCSPPNVANLVLQSPPGSSKKGSASLPPKPPFRRSVSDLSPNNILSRSSSSNGSSSFKWLKKMRDSMNEINQWWDEIMPDTDEVFSEPCDFDEEAEKSGPEDNPADAIEKSDSMTNNEESVCVEKTGDCFIVHFKCPCGKRYQILLSGGNCYYKLM
ncbi:hypothetical protein SADUNF_Sadunf04G0014800 [Salix dunnii]|uniref:Uncharacterized protein n=1 Tax=Salix dunnii TaxID=1413687 RepID=A0A835N038_9ROSI|nr:hypothetical protein SADUNF_Sadunf04G0014800 [Salix dunnii]